MIILIMDSKFKQLQHKINSLVQPLEQHPQTSQKLRVRNLQQFVNKLTAKYEQETIAYDSKLNHYFDQLRKIELYLKDTTNQLEVQQSGWSTKAGKLQKSLRKTMDKLSKERKQGDKKIQNSLQSYLMELATFKAKANNTCTASIRELKELQKDVDLLEKEIKREAQLSKDICRKIDHQFRTQIEEIGGNLIAEERARQKEEQQLFETIVSMYGKLSSSIHQGRKARERQERDIVDLLEKVIEKIKLEILNQ